MSEKRIGTLIYDPAMGRYDIRFGIESYYGGLHCGECFSPLSSSSPSVPYTSYRHSRILPRSVTNRKAGFTYFFLASIIYLLYIRTVSPPRRVFGSPTRYQSSSISIRNFPIPRMKAILLI